jgi:hypothetical protein
VEQEEAMTTPEQTPRVDAELQFHETARSDGNALASGMTMFARQLELELAAANRENAILKLNKLGLTQSLVAADRQRDEMKERMLTILKPHIAHHFDCGNADDKCDCGLEVAYCALDTEKEGT